MTQQYLINIALGPVQEFIASARKLRDLWYGSFLLSELSKAVARSLSEQGCELIFPAVGNPEDLEARSSLNVANKILVLSPAGSDPGKIVAKASQAFSACWQHICGEALAKATAIFPESAMRKSLFRRQVADFGEFYAAWVVYDPADYRESRKRSEQLLAGRKNLRVFMAPTWDGAGIPKSSLDGIRESVISRGNHHSYIVKKGEHLDALGLVKRFGPLADRNRPLFDNMAQVAVQPYFAGLRKAAEDNSEVAEIIAELPPVEALYPVKEDRPPQTDTVWDGWPKNLPVEFLHPAVIAEELRQYDEDDAPRIWQNLHRDLKKLWRKTAEPLPYGCLLVGDGDRMGKTLDCLEQIGQHQQISGALNQFAKDVHPLLEKYQGRVIYSGGDDIMGYVPLHTALECANAVNNTFAAAMEKAFVDTTNAPWPTFSMGLAIIHQHMPLHQALDLARRAEKYAKNEGGRNSLAIFQAKRGGSELVVCGKWQKKHALAPIAERMNGYAAKYSAGLLPSRLGYQLRGIGKECGETLAWQPEDPAKPANVTAAEALRIIGRKRQKSGNHLAPQDAEMLLAGRTNLRQPADELVIAHQISQAKDLASAASFKCKGGEAA